MSDEATGSVATYWQLKTPTINQLHDSVTAYVMDYSDTSITLGCKNQGEK